MSELVVTLNGPQLATLQNILKPDGTPYPGRTHFLPWGRGVGKTQFARFVWYTLVAAYDRTVRHSGSKTIRGISILSLCPTLKQWKDINLAGIIQELAPSGRWGFLGAKINSQSGAIVFPGGSTITPFPATEYNARTARGMRADVLDGEECDDIDAGVYDGVAIPWLSATWSLMIQLIRGTPTRGRHGLWYRTLETCRYSERVRNGEISHAEALKTPVAQSILEVFLTLEREHWPASLPPDPEQAAISVLSGFYGIHATYKDAPETVSPLAVANAKATTPKETFAREWLADPDAGEGLVYAFDQRFHVRSPPTRDTFREFVVGMDHGDVDAGVLLLCGILGHGQDATLWVTDEWYESECPNSIWNQRAQAWRFADFYPDPSRKDRIRELRSLGIRIAEVDNSILAGVAKVADMLHIRELESGDRYARLYVAPKCINTIREFGLYRRKKLPDGTFSEDPQDKNNHAMDALRYACLGRFGKTPGYRHVASGR